jgi:intein/homing endonuclease
MDNTKEKTIFQRLNNLFGPEGFNVPKSDTNRYNINSTELIRTTDKGEYDKAKKQALQNAYLSNQWQKVDNEMYQKSIHYETTRVGAYSDYEAMEFYPEISAALDIMAEEATTPNDKGKLINIYSDSIRVKSILEDLFFNRLDIHTSLPMWTRNTVKYGDNFLFLNIDDKAGVVGARQMPNFEMERRENDFISSLGGGIIGNDGKEKKYDNKVKFYLKGRNVEFNSWQIAHFRLLVDDRKLPYGTCLKGDTRITTENSITEIKDIKKGDLVWSFDEKTQSKVLSPVLDKINSGVKTCYKVSTKHNYFDASEEHRIMVLSNNEFIYKNVKDLKLGDLLIIDKKITTDKEISIDKSFPEENKNGWFNRCEELIPDYVNEELAQLIGFLIGDGWLHTHNPSLAIALGVDDVINDYYIKLLQKYSGNDGVMIENKQFVIHSKLFKTILMRLGFSGKFNEKRIPKWVFECDVELQRAFISGLFDADGWETEDEYCKAFHFELSNEQLVKDIKILLQRLGYKCGKIGSRNRKETSKGILGRTFKEINDSYYITFYDSYNEQAKKLDNINRTNDNYLIEKIISIEEIGDFETYDIYVENENHNFFANGIVVHNSVLEKARRIWKQLILSEDAMLVYRVTRAPERRVYKVYVGNIDDADVPAYVNQIANKFKRAPIVDPQTGQMDLRYNQLAYDQDFFIPVRSETAPNPIDTLPGASNLDQIADIKYLQSKLVTALRVPKTFLGFDEATGDGNNLALEDIRFSRTVNRIQQAIIMELNKIAIIHLYMLGFEDDLDNFNLTLNNPSTQAEMLKVEHLQKKVSLYVEAVRDAGNGFGPMSMTRAKRDILGFSNDEIKQDLLEQRLEKAAAAELEATSKVIKHTGLFDKIDNIYGIPEEERQQETTDEEGSEAGGESGGGTGGGGFGGGSDFGGEEMDFGDAENGGDENTESTDKSGEAGGESGGPVEFGGEESFVRKSNKILTERKQILNKQAQIRVSKYNTLFMDKLLNSVIGENISYTPKTKIYDKTVKINEGVNNMINDIDKMLEV